MITDRARPRHWLVKSEPAVFSFADLMASPERTTCWDGVRNYQARNFMREMQPGDLVLGCHLTGLSHTSRASPREGFRPPPSP